MVMKPASLLTRGIAVAGRKTHSVAVFRDHDVPKYLTADASGIDIVAHGWSFEDLLKKKKNAPAFILKNMRFCPGCDRFGVRRMGSAKTMKPKRYLKSYVTRVNIITLLRRRF